MLIINADDLGRSRAETDAVLSCHRQGRVTSASAMVFMEDSERAAELANDAGIDVGLHLNLTEPFSGEVPVRSLRDHHERIARFLNSSKYALLIYHPALSSAFGHVFQAQFDEFERLYGRRPSHIDGHQHQHLCTNILLGNVIPDGEIVRRSFYFWRGEKSPMNRTYRYMVDQMLRRRYRMTDFFFALSQCLQADRMKRVCALAQDAVVEVMTHPAIAAEQVYLMSDTFLAHVNRLERGTYASL